MIKGKILAVDIDSDGRFVLTVAKEDAPLFKAAPDMYASIKQFLHGIERDCDDANPTFTIHKDSPMADTFREALAKAEGKV